MIPHAPPLAAAPAHPATPESFFARVGSYLRSEDVGLLRAAYDFGEAAHAGQFRKSGEPYISHPLAVADIVAGWQLDHQALSAALLHDVMEDTVITKHELAERFGKPVAELVDGLSKLDRLQFESQEQAQAENFRKMLLAMARDVRVILIKLADRLHNMRTLEVMNPDKRKRIARETQEIYAPIANRIGLNSVYQELDDLSFKFLHPHRYEVLGKAMRSARGNRREVIGHILDAVRNRLVANGVPALVTGREKHLCSIYRKMQDKHLSFAQVTDIYGFRVLVEDAPSCYLALGILHGLYKPIPGKFKDYIAIPKANGYQSLHTTLFGPYGTPIEIQIRTHEMHRVAEAGVASHWLYKSAEASFSDVHHRTHQWLQTLLDIQSESGDAAEFLEHIKVDLFPDEVYIFTPKGKIMALPRGATAIDFAYAVHSDVGNRCVAVKINFELAPLRTSLKNGDRVEIITANNAKPNPSWLNFVATGKARSHIRHYLKTMQYEESVALGERLLRQNVESLNGDWERVEEAHWDRLIRELGDVMTKREILADIGLGKRLSLVVARRLLTLGGETPEEATRGQPVVIRGTEGMAVQFAPCCQPIPGDPILGMLKKGQGLVIHTHDCPSLRRSRGDPEKMFDVEWDHNPRRLFDVNIKLVALNQKGSLAQIAAAISDANANIHHVGVEHADEQDDYSSIKFTLQVENRLHLARIMKALRQLEVVVRINRVRSSQT